MANELFTYERVEAEQCIQGKFYDVPSASAAEEWAVALRARIMTGVQECYDEQGIAPPALMRPLLSSPPSIGIRISYGQLVPDAAANAWYGANKENDLDPNEWFKYTDDDAKKTHFVRAPIKNGYVQCYRVVGRCEVKRCLRVRAGPRGGSVGRSIRPPNLPRRAARGGRAVGRTDPKLWPRCARRESVGRRLPTGVARWPESGSVGRSAQ